MQSSYNVIKGSSVVKKGTKKINTNYIVTTKEEEIEEENSKNYIDSYENLAKNILENARRSADEFITNAYREAEVVEKDAFNRGYELGHEKGYDDGSEKGYKEAYKEAYEKYMEAGKREYEAIVSKGNEILFNCEKAYEEYLKEKEEEVRGVVLTVIENVLKREVKDKDSMNEVIYDVLNECKKSKTFIIKCNNTYYEEVKGKSELWRIQLPFKGDMFIIEDNSVEDGEAIIETDEGKVQVSINIAFDKLKDIVIKER
ncbi:FliH/SctL family protein [Clostridium niameyense]|uniref:FliH/SctL family protein n=1 Tax=Clostridium niameyense TaxID=1622073 RepID=UPI00067E67A3|nr:FliH/SctL family protein [Clostridium niameyense]